MHRDLGDRYGRRLDAYVPLVSGLQEDQRAAEAGATTLPHAHVAECGGEPQLQQWVLGSASNFTVQCPAASGALNAILACFRW